MLLSHFEAAFPGFVVAVMGVGESQVSPPQSIRLTIEVHLGLCLLAQTSYRSWQMLGRLTLSLSYLVLIKQAVRICRPFQAQAFALVMLFRESATHAMKIC
jgi:hypothetical protein